MRSNDQFDPPEMPAPTEPSLVISSLLKTLPANTHLLYFKSHVIYTCLNYIHHQQKLSQQSTKPRQTSVINHLRLPYSSTTGRSSAFKAVSCIQQLKKMEDLLDIIVDILEDSDSPSPPLMPAQCFFAESSLTFNDHLSQCPGLDSLLAHRLYNLFHCINGPDGTTIVDQQPRQQTQAILVREGLVDNETPALFVCVHAEMSKLLNKPLLPASDHRPFA